MSNTWDWLSIRDRFSTLSDCLDTPPDSLTDLADELRSMADWMVSGCGTPSTWIEKHSVNCYYCGALVDERECVDADAYNNHDGGSICPGCLSDWPKCQDRG